MALLILNILGKPNCNSFYDGDNATGQQTRDHSAASDGNCTLGTPWSDSFRLLDDSMY